MKPKLILLLLAILIIVGASTSRAQVSSAQITGVITDPSGAALSNASALIGSKDTGAARQVQSNQSGEFNAPALDPGHYRITIESPGFQTFVAEGIVLTIGEKKNFKFALSLGKAEQAITVSGSEGMINTTSGEISQVIDQRAITELPLNGRDPSSLVFLTTGVTNVMASPIGLTPGGTAFPTETNASAGGGRQGSTFYLLDGSPNMGYLSSCGRALPQCRRYPGVPCPLQQLRCPLWLCARRDRQHPDPDRRKRLPWRRVRVHPEQCPQRRKLLFA